MIDYTVLGETTTNAVERPLFVVQGHTLTVWPDPRFNSWRKEVTAPDPASAVDLVLERGERVDKSQEGAS